jgi:hypothetical protein
MMPSVYRQSRSPGASSISRPGGGRPAAGRPAPRRQPFEASPHPQDDAGIVAGVDETQPAGRRRQLGDEERDELVLCRGLDDVAVEPLQVAGAQLVLADQQAQRRVERRHQQRRRYPLARDVAHGQAEPAVGQRQQVVVVAPDLTRGPAPRGQVVAGHPRAVRRQDLSLDLEPPARSPGRAAASRAPGGAARRSRARSRPGWRAARASGGPRGGNGPTPRRLSLSPTTSTPRASPSISIGTPTGAGSGQQRSFGVAELAVSAAASASPRRSDSRASPPNVRVEPQAIRPTSTGHRAGRRASETARIRISSDQLLEIEGRRDRQADVVERLELHAPVVDFEPAVRSLRAAGRAPTRPTSERKVNGSPCSISAAAVRPPVPDPRRETPPRSNAQRLLGRRLQPFRESPAARGLEAQAALAAHVDRGRPAPAGRRPEASSRSRAAPVRPSTAAPARAARAHRRRRAERGRSA